MRHPEITKDTIIKIQGIPYKISDESPKERQLVLDLRDMQWGICDGEFEEFIPVRDSYGLGVELVDKKLNVIKALVLDTTDFIDRFTTGELPENGQECEIIVHNAPLADELVTATWYPDDPNDYSPNNQPAKGYLGTFIADKISYHVWQQNESEVRYWKPVTK